MATEKVYTVKYERDESGWWVAQVAEVPAAITQGRSLAEARRRVREALAVALDDDLAARAAVLRDLVRLPATAKRLTASARSERARASVVAARAEKATWRAALQLTKGCGLSVRDAGEVLGLSHQRVQQLVSHGEPSRRSRPTSKQPRV